jgi:hypothetical protein
MTTSNFLEKATEFCFGCPDEASGARWFRALLPLIG